MVYQIIRPRAVFASPSLIAILLEYIISALLYGVMGPCLQACASLGGEFGLKLRETVELK